MRNDCRVNSSQVTMSTARPTLTAAGASEPAYRADSRATVGPASSTWNSASVTRLPAYSASAAKLLVSVAVTSMADNDTLPSTLATAATASTAQATQATSFQPPACRRCSPASASAPAPARAQHMPGQRRHHQQAERQQQQPVQQRAADQHRHHHVQQVVQGTEVTPRTDQAQQVPLQQAQHGNPGEQIDQLLPQVRPLQPVQHRAAGHQQQPGRPRPRQRLQSVLAQLSGGEQRPRP